MTRIEGLTDLQGLLPDPAEPSLFDGKPDASHGTESTDPDANFAFRGNPPAKEPPTSGGTPQGGEVHSA